MAGFKVQQGEQVTVYIVVFDQALRVSSRWRVMVLLVLSGSLVCMTDYSEFAREFRLLRRVTFHQPKKVTKKGRHYAGAPVKDTGVPIESAQLSCCEKTRRSRSDSFHRKSMTAARPQWLA